jgi:peroxiredoxin
MSAMPTRTSIMLASLLLLTLAGVGATADQPTVRAVLQSPQDRKAAYNFALKDSSGRTVQLKNYHGKVVLLDFWATACGGCKVEIPWFMGFEHTYKDNGLAVVGVSMDILYEDLKDAQEGWSRVKPFVQTNKVNYTILMGDDPVTKAFDIKSLPDTYLIDRQGRIAAAYTTGLVNKDDVEANIRALLSK